MIEPFFAALDKPETIAIGTARIKGQGVAITRTATARWTSPVSAQESPAISRATGTNLIAHMFAIRTPGADLF